MKLLLPFRYWNVAMLTTTTVQDEELFGWDDTPGIVSVWADREGHALVWRRAGDRVLCERERFRPWLFAAHLDDLRRLGDALAPEDAPHADRAAITYRELPGPAPAYRYLLTAASGRGLERAVLDGAARRLGERPANLGDLGDYYRVGPTEQYLLLTGRVYFRGLAYGDLHRLQFDFETTALDPQRGRIFMAAVRDSRGLAEVLEAPTPDDEARLIRDLCAIIIERDPDIIENHNLFGFDLPFLEARAATYNIPLLLGRAPGPRRLERHTEPGRYPGASRQTRYSLPGRELIDTLDAVRRHDFVARDLPSHRLKDVARHFGVAAPERTYIAGADVFATYRDDPAAVRRYALDDVAEVDGLSQRLMGATFALAGMAPRPYGRLASAGPAMGILEPMLVRAYLHADVALPRGNALRASGNHEGGALHLIAIGVAERVVKADIASLYPSIMRVFRIGPACDHLGILLHIVDRMTTLRLAHKAAARTAPPGSLEAGRHNATQAAMKLLINSAYGYMGAGSMALFADAHAADEVTRRGRELLDGVMAGLRAQGVALIEADTDGVYFAVPPDWSEAQERAVVAEVAATLPQGITLEYEGRYQAMFSHEVKNYALLTYDGRLIVRGVAMRSSRSEPFGERFLRAALECLMRGDVVGVRDAYAATLAALRDRALPAADVASRVRLSKAADEYSATRARQREPQYEALVAAGRTRWRRGERVRFYRASGGAYVWLPDETDETAAAGEWEAEGEGGDEDGAFGEAPATATPRHQDDRRDYDVEHYAGVLLNSYAGRLRKAFAAEDFAQLFRTDRQGGLFDRPVETIEPRWIRP
ncbi:MAG: DNA polymerase domain-containing protein [Anaerolineae bacterium]